MPWKKPTLIAGNYKELDQLRRTCQGGHAHFILRGKDEQGKWKTTQAASYPEELCRVWASCCASAVVRMCRGPCDWKPALSTIKEEGERAEDELRAWDPVVPILTHVESLPDAMLHIDDYTLLYNHAWRSAEPIHQLEARAAVKCVQHACRTPACRQRRVLVLNDNMAVVLAMNKGRCSNHLLLRLCRKVAAHVLSHRLFVRFRYVESARNVADGPTRPWKKDQGCSISSGNECFREFLPPPGLEPPGVARGARHM